jgi:hypothetical protein
MQAEVDACKDDRAELRAQLTQHEQRLTKVENGNVDPKA